MPLQISALLELMSKDKLSQRGLAAALSSKEFREFAKDRGIDVSCYISNQTISDWLKKEHAPSCRKLDVLYLFADFKGYNDIEFYKVEDKS